MENFFKIFITGGMSSGKSSYAENRALSAYEKNLGGSVKIGCDRPHFIATANRRKSDSEMLQKIRRHKEVRPDIFVVHEDYEDLQEELIVICKNFENKNNCHGIILIDSLTMWLSLIFKDISDFDFASEAVLKIANYLATVKCSVITVTDMLAFNMTPADVYLRKFIELNGLMERELSGLSNEAYCIIAGNPISLKEPRIY